VLVIVFADFVLLREEPDYAHRFELRGVDRRGTVTPTVLTEHLQFVTVELPKFNPDDIQPQNELSTGEQWIDFLKRGCAMQSETSPAWETPELRKARAELARLEADPTMRELYERRLRQTQLLASELHDAYQEGHEEGREVGREEGREEGRLAAMRDSVLALLALRYGAAAQPLAPLVADATQSATLTAAQHAIVQCATLEHVRALLEG
jgi:flagellar biosynthesis/type III secretory pathway protein FliH